MNEMKWGRGYSLFRMIMKVLSEIMHELIANGYRQPFEDLEQDRS